METKNLPETLAKTQDSDSNKPTNDELPCTSAAAKLKEAARKSEEELVTAETKESAKKAKTAPCKGSKRKSTSKTKAKTSPAASGSSSVKGNKSVNLKQKQKANRRRRNSSDEEDTNNSTRDVNTNSASMEPKYRSPFILVKRDGSVSVINAPTAEEAGLEKAGAKAKKLPAAKYSHDRKIRGLHSSTLSNKYDAETPDSSWICVFCKRGPHTLGLGDLFGPYLVSSDCEEYRTVMKLPDVVDVDAMFAAKRRRIDMVQTHPRNRPVVPATLAQQQQISPTTSSGGRGGKKKKKCLNEAEHVTVLDNTNNGESIDVLTAADIFLGMSKVSDNSYEVWLHEDCAVWAPDVFLVGARLTSLDSTVWNSARYQCELCSKTGATVCCLQRDCKATAHAPCAKQAGWRLDETTMNVHCSRHVAQQLKQNEHLGFISGTLNYLKTLQTINSYNNLVNPNNTLLNFNHTPYDS